MNTADYCAEGRELYEQWMGWSETSENYMYFVRYDLAVQHAYQAYRQHVDVECDICKQAESER